MSVSHPAGSSFNDDGSTVHQTTNATTVTRIRRKSRPEPPEVRETNTPVSESRRQDGCVSPTATTSLAASPTATVPVAQAKQGLTRLELLALPENKPIARFHDGAWPLMQ